MSYLRRIVSDASPRPSTAVLPVAPSTLAVAPTFTPVAAARDAVDGSDLAAERAPQPVRRRRGLALDEAVTTTLHPQPPALFGIEAAAGIDPATPAGKASEAVPLSQPPQALRLDPAASSALQTPCTEEAESSAPGIPVPGRAGPPARASSPSQLEQAAPTVGSEPPTVVRAPASRTRRGSDAAPPGPRPRAPREAAHLSPTAPAESSSLRPERAVVSAEPTSWAPQPRLATPDVAAPQLRREPAQTQVRIGHVDVFVRDPAPRRSAAPPRPTATASASRHHLRRL